jgi:hypothetical protein
VELSKDADMKASRELPYLFGGINAILQKKLTHPKMTKGRR